MTQPIQTEAPSQHHAGDIWKYDMVVNGKLGISHELQLQLRVDMILGN